jgi:NAD(P)-dependent dehydrogenase (short-subunit alcohol dehydrogenase family)
MSKLEDPREAGPKPPFPAQEQKPVGVESEMEPPPDYGYDSYEGRGRLTDRAALITGGDSGIGRAVALAFAREGADVLIAYLDEHSDAEETVKVVEESGRKALSVPGDVGEPAHCRKLVERAVSEFGHLEILVNNAAYQASHDSITDIPTDEMERIFRTNVFAQFYLCQAAIPHMKPGAVIINTASIQAYKPSPGLIHYAVSKGAVRTFTQALAQQLIEQGIRVNAVAPGPVWTPLIAMSFDGSEVSKFGEQSPMGRPAQPAELAPAYVFLASDESRYVVGDIIGVTGGTPLA